MDFLVASENDFQAGTSYLKLTGRASLKIGFLCTLIPLGFHKS